MKVLLVGLGGFLGAALRFLVTGWAQRLVPGLPLPLGTAVVNLLGCLVLGTLMGVAEARGLLGPGQRVFLLIGVLGGFTTFSTFAWETLALARDAEYLLAAGNVVVQVSLGLIFVWLGFGLGRAI